MKIALQLGYWGAAMPTNHLELVTAADHAGFSAVFAAESWGSDAFTPLSWFGSRTTDLRLGTSVAQISARTPASTAMQAMTLDYLSGGRFMLGLGVSGPQVVEGWYGQPFEKPLARTREYVQIMRDIWEREHPVTSQGAHYALPYPGENATGLGKPLKSIVHPCRPNIPVLIGAEGPKNVALAAEIADGWLATFFSPRMAATYNDWLDEGFSRPSARHTRETFEVVSSVNIKITDDTQATVDAMKPIIALYAGGMGAEDVNFHAQVYRRMGYSDAVDEITFLFRNGQKDKAILAVPDELVKETAIIGNRTEVVSQIASWQRAGVDTLSVACSSVDEINDMASIVKAVNA